MNDLRTVKQLKIQKVAL